MTLITVQYGNVVVMRDGKVGTEQECCCSDCTCEQPDFGTELPANTPISISTDCVCFNNGTLSGSGTLGSITWSSCDSILSSGTIQIGYCGSKLFVVMDAAWQGAAAGLFTPSGRSYGNFAGCPDNDVTESGGSYSGTITLTMDVLTDDGNPAGPTPSTCDVTITLG